MFAHYLKISFRNLWKHRLQTIISIVGLSVGMACFAISAMWLQYIESFEDFVKDRDRLYVLSPGPDGFEADSKNYLSQSFIAENLQKMCSEIEDVYSYNISGYEMYDEEGNVFYFTSIALDDCSKICGVLDIDMKYGCLPKNNSSEIAVSTVVAKLLFDTEDVVGRAVTSGSRAYGIKNELTIVGVFEPLPDNTTLFSGVSIISISDHGTNLMDCYNLIKVYEGTDIDALSDKIRHADISSKVTYYQGITEDIRPDMSLYSLLPLTKLRSDFPSAFRGVNGRNVRIIVAISLITIISVLCHYFITMITLIRIRCRALALRRMLGSSIIGIVGMNVIETLILFIASSVLGAVAIYFIFPVFLVYSQLYTITYEYLIIATAKFWSLVFAAGIVLTFVATLISLRRTQHTILHGHQSHKTSSKLDTVANMIQQTVSLSILFCIGTIMMQITFLKESADLGFDHKNRLSIAKCPGAVKEYLLSLPEIVDSYESTDPLFPRSSYSPYKVFPFKDTNEYFDAIGLRIRKSAVDFWGMTLLEGRLPEEQRELLINETLAMRLPDSIIGSTIRIAAAANPSFPFTIVGIVKDTYDTSVLTQPKPTTYEFDELYTDPWNPCLSLSVKAKTAEDMIFLYRKVWEYSDSLYRAGTTTTLPRSISSMDLHFESIMRNENLLFSVLMLIAVCTLMTTLFGVFSLLSLSLEQRKKEIALRKIHGATVRQVMAVFVRSNILTLLISSAIAFPIAYILMQEWLSVYVRQIPFPWYLGIIIFAAMAILIFLTTIWRIMGAVKENPVEVIKNE